MGWTHLDNPFEYHFDRGLYYHYIAPDMIVGSQPRNAPDVDALAAEGVGVILNLQQVGLAGHALPQPLGGPLWLGAHAGMGWPASNLLRLPWPAHTLRQFAPCDVLAAALELVGRRAWPPWLA